MAPRDRGPSAAPEPSDEDLVRALDAAGAAALAPIYDRHASLVYGLARAILRDPDDAEDLTQEVFLDLERRRGFDPRRGTLAAYLATMTRSRALDRMRTRKRRGEILAGIAQDTGRTPAEPSPLDRLAASEHAARTREALAALPERHRRVIEMAYYDGMSQSEIAAALGAPLGTVKTWARLGLAGLRASLEPWIGAER